MTSQLREELDALADTQTFSPDPTAWDRGRRARRRDRVVRAGAALALVAAVVGAGAFALRPDREPVQPAGEVRGGALPSVLAEPTGETLTDVAIGRASVAYVDSDRTPVLVDASTGEAHRVELPDFPDARSFDVFADYRVGPWLALSPDGRRLAYPTASPLEREPGQFTVQTAWYRTVDLTTGKSDLVEPPECGATPWAMTWSAHGQIAVDVLARPSFEEPNPGVVSCTVDPSTGDSSSQPLVGVMAPGGGVSATFAGTEVRYDDLEKGGPAIAAPVGAVRFATASGTDLERALPTDDYPDGATVLPIGWADNSLLVAQVASDVVMLTSPDRPEPEWTWHTLVEDLPDGAEVSIAVDLIPDLTGDPDQELTHDFSATAPADDGGGDRTPVVLGGLLALLAGLAFLAMMRRRA